jgi:TrmH family RNA methyltransferase
VRRTDRAFLVEGASSVRAALEAGAQVEAVYVDAAGREDPEVRAIVELARGRGTRTFELAAGVLARVADAVNPQPVCAVAGFVDVPLVELLEKSESGPLVVCVDVRDPGNLGAVLRVADASGAPGVACLGTTVDPYNPKAARSSAGSIFYVPVAVAEDVDEALAAIGEAGFRTLATAARGGEDYTATDLTGRVALLLGNEASGLTDSIVARSDGTVTIPMPGRAESLNVAMSAAVLCFESARQRRCLYSGQSQSVNAISGISKEES